MRIDAYNQVAQIYQTQNKQPVVKNNKSGSLDKIEISQTCREYQIAKQSVSASDDVREDKVREIKERIESGNYEVSAGDLAARLIERYKTLVF